jgi:hypothetical protein
MGRAGTKKIASNRGGQKPKQVLKEQMGTCMEHERDNQTLVQEVLKAKVQVAMIKPPLRRLC